MGQVDNHYESVGLNHLGFVVDDVEALIQRCKAAGFEPSDDNSMGAHPYRHRVYFLDNCGVEWEFVEYLSDDKAQQNDYTL